MKEWMKDSLDGKKMTTVLRNERSWWRRVTSGVPQSLIKAPLMFLVYENDQPDGTNAVIAFVPVQVS